MTERPNPPAQANPPDGWDSDIALAGPDRVSEDVAEPEGAWELLAAIDRWAD